MTVIHACRIYSGATSVSLSDDTSAASGVTWTNYLPAGESDTPTATESMELRLWASSQATIRAKRDSIMQLLNLANRRQRTGQGPRVYVEMTLQGGDAYRSELTAGRLAPTAGYLGWQWSNGIVVAVLAFTRLNYFERTTELEVALSNNSVGGPLSGGVVVSNADDSTHDNWVDLDTISGELPAACRLQLKNLTVGGSNIGVVYACLNAAAPTTALVLEGEAATGGSTAVVGGASGGSAGTASLTAASETTIKTWTLSQTLQDALGGAACLLLLRLTAAPTAGTALRLQLRDPGFGTTLWQGEQIGVGSELLIEMGQTRIPPALLDKTSTYPLELQLLAQNAGASGGAPVAISVDDVWPLPLPDGLRRYDPRPGVGLAQDRILIDDGLAGPQVYAMSGDGRALSRYAARGQELALLPGQAQRLYVLWRLADGTSPATTKTMQVRLYYRPRRRSL